MTSKQQALIDLATSFVGIHEVGGDNDGPMVRMFQSAIGKAEKEPWCVSFVQFCAREIDRELGGKPTGLFATESSQMLWINTPYSFRTAKPEPGCVVVWTKYSNDLPLSIGHVGIVKEVTDDGFMLTIEANTSPQSDLNQVVRNSDGTEADGVYLKRRPVVMTSGYMRITGFLRPWVD